MAITQGGCVSFKSELLNGVHGTTDTFKIALYTSSATLSSATTVYSATNEVIGAGYTAGGIALTGANIVVDGSTAILDFNDPQWTNATITARGAMIYNSTEGNKAVCILDFGADKSCSDGTFVVTLPAPTAATGLIRIS